MWKFLAPLIALAAPALAQDSQVRMVDLNALDTHALHEGQGQVAFLALDGNNLPLVARIVFRDGDEQEPYIVDDGRIRFAFDEAGEIAFGAGAVIDRTAERHDDDGAGRVGRMQRLKLAQAGSEGMQSVGVFRREHGRVDELERSVRRLNGV